jgi:hypothetical protein
VNTRTYILSSDTLAAGDTGVDIFESGRTNLTISLSGIPYHYTKFIVDFGDGSDQKIIQHTTNLKLLSSLSVSHIFNPTETYITTYNIGISGYKTDLSKDRYVLNLKVGKSSITDYRSLKIIDAQVFTTPAGQNNVRLTVEAQNPRFVGNLIIPYDLDTSAAIYAAVVEGDLSAILPGLYLRTEIYSSIGGLIPIITEHLPNAYIIREVDLIIFVIGNELIGSWSGRLTNSEESIAICGEADSGFTITDINGDVVTPQLILVPEVSDSNERYIATPTDKNLFYK